MTRVGVVVIGRNEGERLRRCLRSLHGRVDRMVYVDSGSTDGSVEFARSLGVEAISLDMSKPFTMARGRNTGCERLLESDQTIELVQFVDGDCEVAPGWVERAAEVLASRPDAAAVAGRRRERHPEASVYNRLADLEWDAPAGDVSAVGGDVMLRVEALRRVGLFDPALIAGEEPELCFRLRAAGWKIVRVPDEMTAHDAAIFRFGQWWRRAVRGGHAYAEGAWMHGRSPERYKVRETVSIVLWGAALPLGALALGAVTGGWGLLALLAYPLLWARIALRQRGRGRPVRDAALYALFVLAGKFAQLRGACGFWWSLLSKKRVGLIEYKGPVPVGARTPGGAARTFGGPYTSRGPDTP